MVDWLRTDNAFVSELNKYETTKVVYPPAKIVKLTISKGRVMMYQCDQ